MRLHNVYAVRTRKRNRGCGFAGRGRAARAQAAALARRAAHSAACKAALCSGRAVQAWLEIEEAREEEATPVVLQNETFLALGALKPLVQQHALLQVALAQEHQLLRKTVFRSTGSKACRLLGAQPCQHNSYGHYHSAQCSSPRQPMLNWGRRNYWRPAADPSGCKSPV